MILAFLALVAFSSYTVYQGAQGFNPVFIEDVKQRIRADYTAKNMTVVDVTMLRRGPRELTGSVKFKQPGSNAVQQKACTATMADDKATTSWSCQ